MDPPIGGSAGNSPLPLHPTAAPRLPFFSPFSVALSTHSALTLVVDEDAPGGERVDGARGEVHVERPSVRLDDELLLALAALPHQVGVALAALPHRQRVYAVLAARPRCNANTNTDKHLRVRAGKKKVQRVKEGHRYLWYLNPGPQ